MLDLAEDYRHGAGILSGRINSPGASVTLLSIIEFEILLKCAVFLETGNKKFNHKYAEIWNNLPEKRREELLTSAKERCAGHVNLSNIEDVLNDLQKSFNIGRYSYELNDERSDEEAEAAGREWIQNDANEDEADIAYRPMERFSLSFALRHFCERMIKEC